jgi:RNA polymerase sigma-70 factor (ECF subfamily)
VSRSGSAPTLPVRAAPRWKRNAVEHHDRRSRRPSRFGFPTGGIGLERDIVTDGVTSVQATVEASTEPRRVLERQVAVHLPALRARAAQLCRGRRDPEDLVQDTMVRAFRAKVGPNDPERMRGWLLTILTNTFLDALRREKVRPGEVALDIEPSAPPEDDDPAPWASIDLDDVRACIVLLPDDVRDTYRMFALENRDYAAIAAALDIPKATVGTRLMRARKRLRELLLARLEATR